MSGKAWNNFCLPTNTNKYYIFRKSFDSTCDIATAAFLTLCYWPMTYSVVTYIITRNGNSCFFAKSLFLFVGRPLELLATVLFAFIRLSANSHEKSRSVFFSFCGILSCTLCLLYNIQSLTFAMSTRYQKTLINHLLVFTDIRYNARNTSAKSTPPMFSL